MSSVIKNYRKEIFENSEIQIVNNVFIDDEMTDENSNIKHPKVRIYRCEKCGKLLQSAGYLERHKRTRYDCVLKKRDEECGPIEEFFNLYEIDEEYLKMVENLDIGEPKEEEPQANVSKADLITIISDDDDENLPIAELKNRNKADLEKVRKPLQDKAEVRKKQQPSKPFCEPCCKTFASPYYLNCHNEVFHPTKKIERFECKICHELFIREDQIRRHEFKAHPLAFGILPNFAEPNKENETINDEVKNSGICCKICNMKFKYHVQLNRHNFLRHLPPESTKRHIPTKCPYCPKIYVYKTQLNQHIQQNHSLQIDPKMPIKKPEPIKNIVMGKRKSLRSVVKINDTFVESINEEEDSEEEIVLKKRPKRRTM